MDETVLPGTLLNVSGDAVLGEGLYARNGCIYASRVGTLTSSTIEGQTLLSIKSVHRPNLSVVPQIGQAIIGTVTRLTTRYASIDISVLEFSTKSIYLQEPFKGTLRSQDIWPSDDKDAPQTLNLAVRPGDLVRARIIGVGDASAGFLLSVAVEETLGVVFAKCAATGEPLVPISWNEMLCPKSGIKEPRKPAKPQ